MSDVPKTCEVTAVESYGAIVKGQKYKLLKEGDQFTKVVVNGEEKTVYSWVFKEA
jgi:hypothetical protein